MCSLNCKDKHFSTIFKQFDNKTAILIEICLFDELKHLFIHEQRLLTLL